jgi:hypothetical protein
MKGLQVLFGPDKTVFAGKQRLHAEPLCPFITNETGYRALSQSRKAPRNLNPISNAGPFGTQLHTPANRSQRF